MWLELTNIKGVVYQGSNLNTLLRETTDHTQHPIIKLRIRINETVITYPPEISQDQPAI